MKSLRALKQKYIEYMHEKILELYLVYQHKDPLRLFYEENELKKLEIKVEALEWKLSPEDLVTMMFQLYRFVKAAEILKDIVNEANNLLLRKRVYEYVEDWSVRGIIDWPQAIKNYISSRPIVQKVIGYTLNSPENLLLRATIDYILNELEKLRGVLGNASTNTVLGISKEVLAKLPMFKIITEKISNVSEDLRNEVENSFLSKIPSNLYDPESIESLWELVDEVEYMPWKPEWVQKLLDDVIYRYYLFESNIEKVLKRLTVLVIDYLLKKTDLTTIRWALKIYSYKLYEIYCLYLLIKIFEELGMDLEIGYKTIIAYKNDQKIEILFNREVKDLKLPIKAIPDISLKNTHRIVFEVKFSANPSYLSQAVFKVISYMVLYDADKGVLAYPIIPRRAPIEREDEEIYTSIIRKPNEEVMIRINDRQYKLYPLEIMPLENREEENKAVLKTIVMDTK